MSLQAKNKARTKADRQYENALEMYWGGRSFTSLEYLTNLLSENPDHQNLFKMYRLWIEILAENKDTASLHKISTHLFQRSLNKKRKSNFYMAMRGIIHLELDEMQAAELYYTTLKNTNCNNCYVAEFIKRYEFRFDYQTEATDLYSKLSTNFTDYISLTYLSNHELSEGSINSYQKLAEKIQELYPQSPILRLQQIHMSWDQGEYAASINAASSLKEQYPGNQEYSFSLGSAQLLNDDLYSAIESLTDSQNLSDSGDVDTTSLLACIYAYLALNSDTTEVDETATFYMKKAQQLLREHGPESNYLLRLEKEIENRNKPMNNEQPSQQKVWLTQLTAREFSRIKTDPTEEVTDLTMSLGVNVLKGDIILLGRMFEFDSEYQEMRVVALYEAASDAYFDPIQNVCTEITLVHRPESSISIPLESEDSIDDGVRRMYELDDLALEEITNHLEEKLTPEESAHWKESFVQRKVG